MNIITILMSQAIPGMIVAEDVFTDGHHLVIGKDTALTDKMITRLTFYSVAELKIYSVSKKLSSEALTEKDTYYEKIKSSESFHRFHLAYQSTVKDIKNSLDDIASSKAELDPDQLLSDVAKILVQCDSNIELFNMLHCMRHYDDTTYIHSLNVALICNIIGKWLHLSSKDLEILTLSGMLHDLGKLMIPNEIITKPAKLTPEEFSTIQTHPVRGYNLLKGKDIDPRIKRAALMHHERCDGSGYPYGFLKEQIDSFAKLVAIADVYDAMTCARVYRGPLCPFEVLSIFEAEGYAKYDTRYILTFLEGIVQTYINNTVRLSNDMSGEIILINKLELSRPVVRVGDSFIDLTKRRDLQITALL